MTTTHILAIIIATLVVYLIAEWAMDQGQPPITWDRPIMPHVEPIPVHSDDFHIARFANEMGDRMAEGRAKGRSGWETAEIEVLDRYLSKAIFEYDYVNLANYAMMLHLRKEDSEPVSVTAAREKMAERLAALPVFADKSWCCTERNTK